MALLSNIEYKLTEYAAETMVYFEKHKLIEIAKKILVECSLERPDNPQEWIGKNLKRIAEEIYKDCLNGGHNNTIKSLQISRSFLYRIVIFGRPGSGKKTQAHTLQKQFNLVLIDAESLILKHLRGDNDKPYDPLDRELQRAFYYNNCEAKSKALLNIIARRVLENDCLQQGWILLNFAHTLQDFQNLLESFKIPPNKLVYLKCSEKLCMQRLVYKPKLNKPQENCSYYEQEMRFYNQHEKQIEEYLNKRYETISLNGELITEQVRCAMLSHLMSTPYIMGFKQY